MLNFNIALPKCQSYNLNIQCHSQVISNNQILMSSYWNSKDFKDIFLSKSDLILNCLLLVVPQTSYQPIFNPPRPSVQPQPQYPSGIQHQVELTTPHPLVYGFKPVTPPKAVPVQTSFLGPISQPSRPQGHPFRGPPVQPQKTFLGQRPVRFPSFFF